MHLAMDEPDPQSKPGGGTMQPDSTSRRFSELLALGYSVETSALLADAPVSVEAITRLFEPDAQAAS